MRTDGYKISVRRRKAEYPKELGKTVQSRVESGKSGKILRLYFPSECDIMKQNSKEVCGWKTGIFQTSDAMWEGR